MECLAFLLVYQEPMCESSTVIYYESTNSPHTIHHLRLTPAVLQSGPAKFNNNIANTEHRNTTYCLIWGNWDYLSLPWLHGAQLWSKCKDLWLMYLICVNVLSPWIGNITRHTLITFHSTFTLLSLCTKKIYNFRWHLKEWTRPKGGDDLKN